MTFSIFSGQGSAIFIREKAGKNQGILKSDVCCNHGGILIVLVSISQALGVSQNHRVIMKKKVKEMKAEMEREQKARKQREKEQKTGKKEGKFEKMGFMKKKGVYNINN